MPNQFKSDPGMSLWYNVGKFLSERGEPMTSKKKTAKKTSTKKSTKKTSKK